MPFAYYDRLSARGQAIYRRSDAVVELPLPEPLPLRPLVELLQERLRAEDRRGVEHAAAALADGITRQLSVAPVAVSVLAVRPSSSRGELHGLYTSTASGRARIQVWMRTARFARVVASRTFLRTLLHELTHHLDYCHLKLADSLHTEGFFKRESSLTRQLAPRPLEEQAS